jgi:hypothetical protein
MNGNASRSHRFTTTSVEDLMFGGVHLNAAVPGSVLVLALIYTGA